MGGLPLSVRSRIARVTCCVVVYAFMPCTCADHGWKQQESRLPTDIRKDLAPVGRRLRGVLCETVRWPVGSQRGRGQQRLAAASKRKTEP